VISRQGGKNWESLGEGQGEFFQGGQWPGKREGVGVQGALCVQTGGWWREQHRKNLGRRRDHFSMEGKRRVRGAVGV